MGPGQKILTLVGSAFYGLGMDLDNFPLKCQNFQYFALRVKKYLGQSRVSLLFTAGQKYVWVGSGPISNGYKAYKSMCRTYK